MKKSQIKKLDTLWSKKVKEKAHYCCEYCLREGRQKDEHGVWLNSAHIIGRRYRGTRWGAWIDDKYDLCGMCLCFSCHKEYDEHGPLEAEIRKYIIGGERYHKIRNFATNVIAKHQDYEEIKGWLEKGGWDGI